MEEQHEIEAFVQAELKPIRVGASVPETADLALRIDTARRLPEPYGWCMPRLELNRRSHAVARLIVRAAGPITLGFVEIVKHGDGCLVSFDWRGGSETFDTARKIREALKTELDELDLLQGTPTGRPRLTSQEWRERAEKVAMIEKIYEEEDITLAGACLRCGVPPSTFKWWRARLAKKR